MMFQSRKNGFACVYINTIKKYMNIGCLKCNAFPYSLEIIKDMDLHGWLYIFSARDYYLNLKSLASTYIIINPLEK